jgi:hypothetical protein
MATPADQRLLELLEKWLESLELHAKYSSLDDESYWKIQPWVEHQRPSRWIIELAMQKTIALRSHVQERVKMGDAKYADSLELMIFLANLVGSEHIERFIPSAEAQKQELPDDATPPVPATGATTTREMPKFVGSKRAPAPPGNAQVARTERKVRPASKQPARPGTSAKAAAPVKPSGRPASRISPAAASGHDGPSDVARAQVIADAARLVQWGRKWYELPELIARMADRPALPEVRRILKENKSAIDAKAGGA